VRDDVGQAFERLLAARTPALLRTAFLLTGDREAARDLLQSALERVHPRLRGLREPQALEAYVRATMATTAANARRRRWHGETPTSQPPDRGSDDDSTAFVDARLSVVAALKQLPADQRAVLVLRFHEDMSEAEVASVLGLPHGTVKSRTSRALAALRQSGLILIDGGSGS
jgi:RNA polymerase sigma-70 factor (ECF subfamily)